MTEPEYTAPDLTLLGEDHINAYRETDGEVGYLWNGVPTLLLTATGRRTGEPRTSALIFARDGDDYLVVASMGGWPTHPQWYLNVTANPQAEIQVKGEHIPVVARTASAGGEAPALEDRERRSGRTTTCTRPAPSGTSRSSCSPPRDG